MLFTSPAFLLYFMPVALLGFHLLGKIGRRPVIAWLSLMSIVFYAQWNVKFVGVLLGSLLLNYAVSRFIDKTQGNDRKQQIWVWIGVGGNLAILCFFKYLFPTLSFLHNKGWSHHDFGAVILPLGISFFTFTQIAYLIDLSQGEATSQNFVEYSLFVTFFPHLIAGPILHHKEMMPQFSENRRFRLNPDDVLLGINWFILGLAKKTIIADQVGMPAEQAFLHVNTLGMSGAWLAIILYSMQLYFDFSGYSDMAIGLARMFSIRFPLNFNSPYKATGIIDYWQRFHMTLTRYLTLYIYNPISLSVNRSRLAAGKKTSRKATRTLEGFLHMVAWPTMATMFLAGLWHGAGVRFLIFGLLHGLYLTVNNAWRNFRGEAAPGSKPSRIGHAASVLLTYACVVFALVFFRANTTADAYSFAGRMFGLHGFGLGPTLKPYWFIVLALFPVVWFCPNTQQILGVDPVPTTEQRVWSRILWRPNWAWSVAMGVVFLVALVCIQNSATFLYFQF